MLQRLCSVSSLATQRTGQRGLSMSCFSFRTWLCSQPKHGIWAVSSPALQSHSAPSTVYLSTLPNNSTGQGLQMRKTEAQDIKKLIRSELASASTGVPIQPPLSHQGESPTRRKASYSRGQPWTLTGNSFSSPKVGSHCHCPGGLLESMPTETRVCP